MEVAVAESYVQGTQPFVDGFGERRVVIDARGERLDVLRLNPSLSAVPAFEAALRERAGRISGFRHEAFSRVRSVETDRTSGSLLVISDHVRGARLSALLAAAEKRSVQVDMPALACLMRQLVNATAAWREQMPDVVHGAIGPDRVMITPDGRVILVEHILGAALEQLQYPRQRYWEELGVALPTTFKLVINARADVLQVGAVALALVLGRRLKSSDRLEAIQPAIGLRVAPPFRTWLLRALQLDPLASFASVLDAREALNDALGAPNLAAEQDGLLLFMARCLTLDVNTPLDLGDHEGTAGEPIQGSDDLPDVDLATRIEALKAFLAHRSARRERGDQAGADEAVTALRPTTETPARAEETPPAAAGGPRRDRGHVEETSRSAREPFARPEVPALRYDDPPLHTTATATPEAKSRDTRVGVMSLFPVDWSRRLWLAAGATLIIAIALIAIVAGGLATPGAQANGVFSITTSPAGISVNIDGTPRGVTPLTLDLEAGDHLVELVTGTDQRKIPVTIKAGSEVSQYIEMAGAATSGATELRVRTEPLAATVTVDGRVVGRSPVSVTDLSPGSHTVVVQHEVGSATEQVLIEPGKTASLFIPLAPRAGAGAGASPVAGAAGWISVAAPVDVQLFEGGRFLGSSRIDRIMVPAGRHDLEIVNEQLGYQERQSVRVTAGQVSAVRLAWPNGSLSINAVPWAEAFIDGRPVGETPIGNFQVPIGTHQITFRHPQLGERSTSVTVTTREPARVGMDLRAK
jgi:hypothetical protein